MPLRRRRVLHAFACLMDRSGREHGGRGRHYKHVDAYQKLFRLTDTCDFGSLTGYELAWLVLAVLLKKSGARDEWLEEFGLTAGDLWTGHLMLNELERARVATQLDAIVANRWWSRSAVAVLLDAIPEGRDCTPSR
jgi:hypothetical protein